MADILKIGLGILEENAVEFEMAYDLGRTDGYFEAKREFMVTYRCSVCRKVMEVSGENEKAAIAAFMEKGGWGHNECIDREK